MSKVSIESGTILPALTNIMESLYSACDTKDESALKVACITLWQGVSGLDAVASCFTKGGEFVTWAIGEEKRKAAEFITAKIGIDPMTNNLGVSND